MEGNSTLAVSSSNLQGVFPSSDDSIREDTRSWLEVMRAVRSWPAMWEFLVRQAQPPASAADKETASLTTSLRYGMISDSKEPH